MSLPDRQLPDAFSQGRPASDRHNALPEIMFCLERLASLASFTDNNTESGYDGATGNTAENGPQELRRHILMHLCSAIRAEGACLLLYHASQYRFIPVATQGTIACGNLAATLLDYPIQQFITRGPGEILTRLSLGEQQLLLVTLSLNDGLLGIVALALSPHHPLGEERHHLLSAMGQVAARLLYDQSYHQRLYQEAVEAERKRLAQELHDGLAQQLTHVSHKLEYMQRLLEKRMPEQVLPEVKRAQGVLQESLRTLRYTLSDLLPQYDDERPLPEKIQTLMREYRKNHPTIEFRARVTGLDELLRLSPILEKAVLGFVREALNNVWKHAHATRVQVQIFQYPQHSGKKQLATDGGLSRPHSGRLVIEISDNGIGFRPEQVLSAAHGAEKEEEEGGEPHFGLWLMRERIQELGGGWELRSAPGQGTIVRAYVPIGGRRQTEPLGRSSDDISL